LVSPPCGPNTFFPLASSHFSLPQLRGWTSSLFVPRHKLTNPSRTCGRTLFQTPQQRNQTPPPPPPTSQSLTFVFEFFISFVKQWAGGHPRTPPPKQGRMRLLLPPPLVKYFTPSLLFFNFLFQNSHAPIFLLPDVWESGPPFEVQRFSPPFWFSLRRHFSFLKKSYVPVAVSFPPPPMRVAACPIFFFSAFPSYQAGVPPQFPLVSLTRTQQC